MDGSERRASCAAVSVERGIPARNHVESGRGLHLCRESRSLVAGSGASNFNANTPERLKAFGLDVTNAADRTLLTSRMDSPAVVARGFQVPYAGFPVGQNLAQALRPFPQFAGTPSAFNP